MQIIQKEDIKMLGRIQSRPTLDPSVTDTVESLERELEAARTEVDKSVIPKNDICVMKSLSKPPVLVVMVLEAYAILSKQKGKDLWHLGARSLAQHHLVGIDINSISLSVLKKLQFYIENPKINEDTLRPVFSSIVSVWKWIESVYHYGAVAHKYGIRAEEKGIRTPVQQESITAQPSSVVKEKKEKSFVSLELSETDTIESLEKELAIARNEVGNCLIPKNDIYAVKSMHKPPALVKIVLEAYAILYNQKGENLWRLGLQALGKHNAASFELDNIPISALKKLRKYIEEQNIDHQELRKVSASIVSVWKWVESVYHYGTVAHKYGIRAEEKGIRTPVQQESITTQPSSVVKEKKEKSFFSLELSETDTIESLEEELAIARNEVGNCLIHKDDISEVKSMPNPPALVIMVLEAYAILSKQKGKNLWHLGVRSLAQHHLVGIDINNISLSVLKKLQFYIESPKINEDTLRPVSCCIVSVWKWIESVYHYGAVAHKYGIRAEEKGIRTPVQQESITAQPSSVVKEKKEKSFVSLELSETDTIESLEEELAIARNEVGNCLIHKNDIYAVKSMHKPPALVKIVLEAYAILSKQKGENLWHLGAKSLAQHNAASFELDNIPISALKKLRKYIEEQNIDHQELRKVSASIVSIWKWVESVYHYGVVAYKLDQLNTNKYSKDTS